MNHKTTLFKLLLLLLTLIITGCGGGGGTKSANTTTSVVENTAYMEVVEGISSYENAKSITAKQLNSLDGVSGAVEGISYGSALVSGIYVDRNHPTYAEIQVVVDSVNNERNTTVNNTTTPVVSNETNTAGDNTTVEIENNETNTTVDNTTTPVDNNTTDGNTTNTTETNTTVPTDSNETNSTEDNTTVSDSTLPIITLIGDAEVNVTVGATYSDAGATADDNKDGNITNNIVTQNPVNINKVDTYTITYDVNDTAGNPATQVTRTVNVIADSNETNTTDDNTTNPTENNETNTTEDNTTTPVDNNDTNTTDGNTTNTTETNTTVPTDSNETNSTEDNTTVSDTTLPIITLIGDAEVNVTVGTAYTDAGATADDNKDGNITNNIVTQNLVNTDTVGTYTITYDVNDTAGNVATQVTRTVNVTAVPDTTLPIITLTGDAEVNVIVGTTYTDAGATANDDVDGNITNNIVTQNPVNTDTVGSYTITYDVNDTAGNVATQVTRIVTVNTAPIPNIAPTITGTPKTTTNIYNTYQFLPTSSDANNDTLIFTIENKPSWAEFNGGTGLFKGNPSLSDEGNYSNIVISVSDGKETMSLAPFSIEVAPAVNLAPIYGKATQGDIWDAKVARNAIDNDTSTYNHANDDVPNNWWQLELLKGTKVHKIVIHNSTYRSERLANAKMYINSQAHVAGSTNMGTLDKTLTADMVQVFTYDPPVDAHYILMQGNLGDGSKSLHMGEVEVYGELPLAPHFESAQSEYFVAEASNNGTVIASISAIDFQNDILTYSIVENVPFSIDKNGNLLVNGSLDYGNYIMNVVVSDGTHSTTKEVVIRVNKDGEAENIAHKFGVATQGDIWDAKVARNAIDNDTSTYNHANDVIPNNWWQLELPKGTKVHKIVIHNSTYHSERLENAKMYINSQAHVAGSTNMGTLDKTLTADMAQIFTYDPPVDAHYILMQGNLGEYGSKSLHIGEVEAYGVTPPTPDFKDKNEFKITIDKWQSKTQSIFDVNAVDYQYDTIMYSLDGDVPFIISADGKINVSDLLTVGDYTFDIVISDGVNTRRKPITMTVVADPIKKTEFRTNDNQPELSGLLPNIYNEGDNVSVEINGITYPAIVSNGMWQIENDTITPALEVGLHDVKLIINGTDILYADYFEVYAERMQSIKKSLSLETIADVPVTIVNTITTPLIKDERVRGNSIRLYVENGVTKLQNKSYRAIASLLGKYEDANGDSIFVKLIFSENIKPYSDNNLSTFSHDTQMQIVTTASHFNGEFSFGGADCTASVMDSTMYCTPTTKKDVIYSDSAVQDDPLSEQQLYSIALATYNHFYNSIDGLKMMKAWVEKSTYKNMDFTGDYQSIDKYIGDEEKMSYLYRHFYNFTMPEHHVSMRAMRYKYAAQGMASLTAIIPLDGSRSSSGWSSLWERTIDLDGASDYEYILHEIGHAYSNSHSSGMSYGWPHAFRKVVSTLYTVKQYPVVNVPKYVFETKVVSSTKTKITVYNTTAANEDEMTFELLSSTPLIVNDLTISSGTDDNSVILTNNKGITTRLFVRVYGDDSKEIASKLLLLK